MNEQKNLILAISLSVVILLGFTLMQQHLFPAPPPPVQQATTQQGQQSLAPSPGGATAPQPIAPAAPTAADIERATKTAIAAAPRLDIDTPAVKGSIALRGGRIDDLVLKHYRETVTPGSELIRLFRPAGAPHAYYVEHGWVGDGSVKLPDATTEWQSDGRGLTPDHPVTLRWDNGAGLRFERRFAIDPDYLISVTQRVINTGTSSVTLNPYALLSRRGTPYTVDFYILHEGPIGVLDGTLTEIKYSDLKSDGKVEKRVTKDGGWIGITDKYWLAALIPGKGETPAYRFVHAIVDQDDRYQVDYTGNAHVVAPGQVAEVSNHLFAGAKSVLLLDQYEKQLGITNFDRAVDFGWFYFLTKPFFYALHWLNGLFGNFGLAILAFTVLVKLAVFPLANKSYKSMAKLKELTPQMQVLREKYGEDRQRLNTEMMALYKKEKANPASGCLPIFVQIPIFFALYKVLFVSIEMRHAPFYGWINDLSAPDPTTVFNAFGLIPFTPPDFLHIGAWPIIMGITMWLQQRLNPQPTDPIQAKVFMFLPIFFTFLLAQFAAGLVIYWTWNNLLSISQQWFIMKRTEKKKT
jgi:YidC/Oxa1 family membrane protein insertase